MSELNCPIVEMDLTDINGLFHPTAEEYSLVSVAYGTISRVNHILCHKATLNKYTKIKIFLKP
jgi:hypothetical protein